MLQPKGHKHNETVLAHALGILQVLAALWREMAVFASLPGGPTVVCKRFGSYYGMIGS